MLNKKIKINDAQSGQRIDKFLASFYVEKSRSFWQKKIKNGEILVNDKKIKADYLLKINDKVQIFEVLSTLLSFLSATQNNNLWTMPEIEIIYEDKNVIVINKPAGVLSQSAMSSTSPAISDFLVNYFPEIQKVGQDEQRFGIVHRLDKDTSGVMIIAKNNKSFAILKNQFKNRKVKKTYIALVYGIVLPKDGIIDLKIGRSKTNPLIQTVIDSKKKEDIKSREAITNYKTIKTFKTFKTFKKYTLLEVCPQTGRMHQIRVHLKALGFPIVGDKKYFFKKYIKSSSQLDRQFLHASKLEVEIPDHKKTIFTSKLAKDLKNFLIKI